MKISSFISCKAVRFLPGIFLDYIVAISKINILLKYVLTSKKATGGFSVPLLFCVYPFFHTSAMISNERSLSAWSNVSELIMISFA